MVRATFPSCGSDTLPEWLHAYDWTDEHWEQYGKQWLQDVASCFSVQTYWETHFHAIDRLNYAKTKASVHGDDISASFVLRVQDYLENMLQDLRSDAVSEPSGLSGS